MSGPVSDAQIGVESEHQNLFITYRSGGALAPELFLTHRSRWSRASESVSDAEIKVEPGYIGS